MSAHALRALLHQPSVVAPTTISGLLESVYSNILSSAGGASQQIAVPSVVPADASPPIDPSFPGFAFEQSSFYNYSFDASGNPNVFSHNLINDVLQRTGGTPILRVGGTSGDKGSYDPTQTDVTNRPATEGGPAYGPPYLSVGPSYFDAFGNFPNVKFIFMVPLEQRNLSNSLEWARQGLQNIGDRLEALEIGNEPDLYSWYSTSEYTSEYNDFAKALAAEFPDKLGGQMFQALDIAWAAGAQVPAKGLFQAGINSTGQVKQIAYHLYQRSDPVQESLASLQSGICNHAAIVQQLAHFVPDIKYLQSNSPSTPFLLSEVGNSLGNLDIEYRNVLATALWNVDYQLYAMSIGVSRVNNQQIVWPGYQMWEPVDSGVSAALVRPNFYSQPLIADFISNATTTNGATTRVINIDAGSDYLSAYAAYDNGNLARIAIVNLNLWTPSNGTRSAESLSITGLPKSISQASIATLTAPEGAFANDTLTYGGYQWTYENQGLPKQVGDGLSTAQVNNGNLQVTVSSTSAVLIYLS